MSDTLILERLRLLPSPDDIRLVVEHGLPEDSELEEYEEDRAEQSELEEQFFEMEWLHARRAQGSYRADIVTKMH